MKKYQLVVFRFTYMGDLSCIWPVCFDFDTQNNVGIREWDVLNLAVDDLQKFEEIEEVQIIQNEVLDLKECVKVFEAILNIMPEDDNVIIKYLTLERKIELVSQPRFDYESNSYYTPILLKRTNFPVRIRSINFKFLLDDLELPVLILKEEK